MRLIAGPCQHESFDQSLKIAKSLHFVCQELDIDFIFKTLNKKSYPRLILMEDSSQSDWDENILE